jgi:hypothetical protein
VEEAEPEQIKKLLPSVIEEIVVESRANIQPYFVWPGVRMVEPSRRRTPHNTNPDFPGQGFWLDSLPGKQ